MDAVAPSWYPDPQRDGMLRWWDGTRWTEHVQPARAAGKPVLGQEVTAGIGPITYYAPGEQITHAFPPVTDDRYAGSPLAALLAEQASSGGGGTRVSAEHQAALEAAYQLRAKGGLLGSIAGIGEQLLVDTINDAVPEQRRPATVTPGPDGLVPFGAATWSPTGPAPERGTGPAAGSSAPSPWTQSTAEQAQYRAVSVAVRGATTVVGMWGLISSLGAAVVVMLVGVVVAVALPTGEEGDWLVWMFPLIGAVGVVLATRELVHRIRSS